MNFKTGKLLFAFALCFAIFSANGFAQSQGEMNEQAYAEFSKADAELNRVYKQTLAKLDPETQTDLKQAQIAWIAFRDAEADAEANAVARGGTMAVQLRAISKTEMTKARIRQLRDIIKSVSGR